ncbi:hypothetical protein YC2023_020834 [Brassica napus]
MWGGTSSIGSGEAELTYFNGGLSYFLCPFDFVLLLQMVSISGVLMGFLNEVSSWRQLERV